MKSFIIDRESVLTKKGKHNFGEKFIEYLDKCKEAKLTKNKEIFKEGKVLKSDVIVLEIGLTEVRSR